MSDNILKPEPGHVVMCRMTFDTDPEAIRQKVEQETGLKVHFLAKIGPLIILDDGTSEDSDGAKIKCDITAVDDPVLNCSLEKIDIMQVPTNGYLYYGEFRSAG